jgi:hypothetical protein
MDRAAGVARSGGGPRTENTGHGDGTSRTTPVRGVFLRRDRGGPARRRSPREKTESPDGDS